MSSENNDPEMPVSNRLCQARRETLEAEIKGLKTAIWAASATATTIILIAEVLLRLLS